MLNIKRNPDLRNKMVKFTAHYIYLSAAAMFEIERNHQSREQVWTNSFYDNNSRHDNSNLGQSDLLFHKQARREVAQYNKYVEAY